MVRKVHRELSVLKEHREQLEHKVRKELLVRKELRVLKV
jgi:hypothetical protein